MLLNRRRFAGLLGATAIGGFAAPALIRPSFAQGAPFWIIERVRLHRSV
jgi:hypothetical protein